MKTTNTKLMHVTKLVYSNHVFSSRRSHKHKHVANGSKNEHVGPSVTHIDPFGGTDE